MKSISKTSSRRKFIAQTLTTVGGITILGAGSAFTPIKSSPFSGPGDSSFAGLTVQQIIDLILKEGKLTPFAGTVDTLKSGSANIVVTGIVTTMFATIAVIEEAARLGANFIIAHEPTFYNHTDNPDWVKDNHIVKQKQALLAKYNITVWRFHDYIHSIKPDLVAYGTAKKLGWLQYFKTGRYDVTVPPMSLQALITHLKKSLGITHVRVIGDLNQQVSHIGLLPGAPGGQRQVTFAETEKPDVIVAGELQEWETAEYMRDQKLLGGKMALVLIGHNFSEDPGMWYLVEWLQPKLPGMKITHVASGEAFEWM
ncbi:Nif3-like dinuclear metal center hexameric protein [Mucilaginibacter sp. ZT4R22]|uniref:Nif3-like dinuclear metal center hexameric protein n=1 Tax=Mucilaginibacter pankratovii TaxID=2772110 RepID=A0ABR7WWN1_9SPHI|nr:Nif3-like dinuclear metal center hexameric protein [Mucilaginibacter pankratovii]MBD1366687.1 Nif3-like dinuclear metal center hexameric protein [Mucilaginibacter pankratovii]